MADRFWVGGSGNFSDNTNHWSATSGGAPGASKPSTSDNAIWNAGSGGGTCTFDEAVSVVDMTFTGYTGTWAGSTTTSISGSLTLASGITVSYTGAITFTATTSKTLTSAGKTFGSTMTFNGAGGTWTLQDALTSTAAVTLTAGTFAANNFSVTCAAFSSSNANSRTVSMGSGTWTLTGTGTVWDCATVTNLTVTPATSTIKLTDASSTAKTFSGGGKTYNNLWLTGAGTGTFDIVGSNTFADLKCDTPPHTIRFTAGTTTTVTTFTVNGTSAQQMTITSITAATHALVKAGAGIVIVRNCTISYSVASPADTWYAR